MSDTKHTVRRGDSYWDVGRIALPQYPSREFWARTDLKGNLCWAVGQYPDTSGRRDIPSDTKQWSILEAEVARILAPRLAAEATP